MPLRRALSACLLAACVAGFQPTPSCRPRRRVAAPSMAESMADGHGGRLSEETLAKLAEGKFAASVRELAAEGMTKADLEKAFKAALVAAYLDGDVATVAPSAPARSAELRRPATASDAQAAFRQAYTGRIVTSPTQKFLSAVIEDRAGAFSFKCDRVLTLTLSLTLTITITLTLALALTLPLPLALTLPLTLTLTLPLPLTLALTLALALSLA